MDTIICQYDSSMTLMEEAALDNVDIDAEAIDTAVSEPSLAWLPDPAAHIGYSVSGTTVPKPAASCAEAPCAASGSTGTGSGEEASRHAAAARPQAQRLRKGFLDRPRKRAALSASAAQPIDSTSATQGRDRTVDQNQAVAAVSARPSRTPAPPRDFEAARKGVFRRLQPLCAALLPLRADAQRLAPALRALQEALREADPIGLQARPL